jgi:presenilin-like A22 family membrane protease
MKHNITATTILLGLFLLSQFVGLLFISSTINVYVQDDIVNTSFDTTTIGDRPESEGFESAIILFFGITIGTLVLLYIARKNKINLWKAWFFIASVMTISISISTFLSDLTSWIIAIILVSLRFYKPSFITTNLSEILMYSGLAIFLVPILNVPTMIFVLIIISIYDMYAVWKSKHMITMAKFTSENNIFPGLSLKYTPKKEGVFDNKIKSSIQEKKAIGILGGGDVVFPLLFSGTVFVSLIIQGFSKTAAFQLSSIISIFSMTSLFLLFYFSKKTKFYPAMPFLSIGCILGYFIILLII